MITTQHTPGPWRWEINEKSKSVQLCGGRPQFDLTVTDFVRWGMGGATPRFRDSSDMGLLDKCIKWAKAIRGREHHAHWLKSLDHPDARLIAAAPDLLAVLQELEESSSYWSDYDVPVGIVDRIKAAIARATGKEPA
jgi:hypothetical protein